MTRSFTASFIGILVLIACCTAAKIQKVSNGKSRGHEKQHARSGGIAMSNYVVNNNGVSHGHSSKKNQDPDRGNEEEEIQKLIEQREAELQEIAATYNAEHPDKPIDAGSLSDMDPNEIRKLMNHRQKRYVTSDLNKRWDKGVVPYTVNSNNEENDQLAITAAQKRMEKHTCIRFVPWVDGETKTEYGLSHNGHIDFTDESGCWSYIGNLKATQGLSCCSKYTCVHELGHAMGLGHEHQSPLRDGWIRVNYEHVNKAYWVWYEPYGYDSQITYGHYDVTSTLHYSQSGFNVNGGKTWTSLFPEFKSGENMYYEFYEIALSHDCKALECPDFTMTCENDGYVNVINGVCTCMCPNGLDGATGCTTTITEAATNPIWPGGSYSLVAPYNGCPSNDLAQGEVTHWSDGGSSNSYDFDLDGNYGSESTNMHFCTMENSGNSVVWPEGVYCIHRYGEACPAGFEEGFVQFDDVIRSSTQNNTNSGTIPDGEYDIDTLFYFCCRGDGFEEEPLELPNQAPFVLYKYGSSCQTVKGMSHIQEYYTFNNLEGSTLAEASGSHPDLSIIGSSYTTKFCYYTPLDFNCGGVIDLTSANPTAVITTPNYPNDYDSSTQCNWLIKGPVDSTILLNFDEFEVEEYQAFCYDTVEIRHNYLGQKGIKYCGYGFDKSIRSIQNTIAITFQSGMYYQEKGFSLTATLVLPEDHCYKIDDLGKTYRGKVNFTRNMEPCLPWAEATQCPHNPWNDKNFDDGLDGNYCRNPGDGLRPWCYTGYNAKEGCLRNYCDVCLLENIYDTKSDCATLAADGTFCDEDPEAFSGCAKTCAASLPSLPTIVKVSDVTCAPPTMPVDGSLVSQSQTSYNVGDTVTVKCNDFDIDVMGTCLTDGSWNIGNFVCGVCPTGWGPHDGYCFKYFEQELMYDEAVAKCAEFGAVLAPAYSQEEMDYVISRRPFMSNKIWLGASDSETEGTWRWQADNTVATWFNWYSGQPSNYSDEDCAYILKEDKDSEWKDTYCFYDYPFVCRKDLYLGYQCLDRQDDCQDLFEVNPSSCMDYPPFANQECVATCGWCGGTPSCTVPTLELGTEISSGQAEESTIDAGEVIVYNCAENFVRTDGNLKRGCKLNGELTGSPPVCTSLVYVETPINSVDLVARPNVGSSQYVYTGPMDQFTISRTGQLVKWLFHSKYAGTVCLQVWRLQSGNSYKFIGQNVITTGDNVAETVEIEPQNKINVEVGDFIGVYYPATNKGGVSYDYCDGTDGEVIKIATAVSDESGFTIGDDYTFSESTLNCRLFSVNAMIAEPETYIENNDGDIIAQTKVGIERKTYTGPMPELYIPESGYITKWHYHSKRAGEVGFQVFRQISNTSYILIGENRVTIGLGILSVDIDPADRIQVEKGDYIGIYYFLGGAQISLRTCPISEGITAKIVGKYNYEQFVIGNTYAFSPYFKCRHFSVKAEILVVNFN